MDILSWYIIYILGGANVEIVINELARKKIEERNLQNNYIKLYYSGFG